MKKFKSLILILIGILTLTFLVSCDKKANIEIINVTPMRTRISLTIKVDDPDGIITSDSVSAVIYDSDDDKVSSLTFDELVEDEQTKIFEDLEEESTYKIVVKATVDDKSKTFYSKNFTTTTEGKTKDNAIKVTTKDEFLAIQYDNDAYYSIENDISFADVAGNNETVEPLFDESTPFMGHIIGNGHKISGITISSSDVYSGLFGYLGIGSSVEDLNLADIALSSTKGTYLYMGALAGCNLGTVKNVKATNITISHQGTGTTKQYIGGLLGVNGYIVEGSSVETVKMTLRSRLQSTVGGLIGSNGGVVQSTLNGAYVNNSYAKGVEITTTFVTLNAVDKDTASNADFLQTTGGFVGESKINITNSYCDAKITGSSTIIEGSSLDHYMVAIGGFAGRVLNASKVENCVSNATISYETKDAYTLLAGALIGEVVDSTVKNSFAFLSGDNKVIDTADYTDNEDKDILELFFKSFEVIGLSRSVLTESMVVIDTVGYKLVGTATIDSTTEGALTIGEAGVTPDVLQLSEAVLAFYNQYNA
jgi:hypothetical protein